MKLRLILGATFIENNGTSTKAPHLCKGCQIHYIKDLLNGLENPKTLAKVEEQE